MTLPLPPASNLDRLLGLYLHIAQAILGHAAAATAGTDWRFLGNGVDLRSRLTSRELFAIYNVYSVENAC